MGVLRSSLATPDGKSRYVRRLFARIADRYDLITVMLSWGLDRRWKERLIAMSGHTSDDAVLDLACGTGDITFGMMHPGGLTVGLDITHGMIQIACGRTGEKARRTGAGPVRACAAGGPLFLVGDMMALPFADAAFDIVTTGYGVRNVPVIETALREVHRLLRPGGRFLSLDFNRPRNRLVRAAYLSYLTFAGSMLGLALHRDADTYRYIPESIRSYPGADGVTRLMRNIGFVQADHVRLLGGLMAIHHGFKPGARATLPHRQELAASRAGC